MTAKDLKNALLQEAVQGTLVPQIAAEGCAKDLLDKIKTESSLRSKSQIRVTKKELPPVTAEEIPFDIPENWCWCRLSDICNMYTGDSINETEKKLKYKNISDGWNYIGTKDVGFDQQITYDNGVKIPYSNTDFRIAPKDTVLMCIEGGSAGRKIAYTNQDVCFGNKLCCFNPFLKDIESFLYFYLQSTLFTDAFKDNLTGIIGGVSINTLKKMLIPLPPLAEQKRIVAAIEKFMPLIEEYGKKETELNLLNAKIGALTKKAILQEAVQGRLVPQIAAEGNARDLLEEIKKNHTDLQISTKSADAKSDLRSKSQIRVTKKELPPVTAEEIPFDIPENWCWCRLSDICNMYTGDSINETEKKLKYKNISDGWNYIGTKDVGFDQQITYDNGVKIPYSNTDFRIAPKDTVLMCIEGGSAGRKIAYTNQDVCFGNKLCCFNPFLKDIESFLYFYLQSTLFTDAFKDNLTGIIGGVSINTLKKMLIPLPPLAEQKRIVAAIEQLLPLCKKLGQ